jgi:hypothetical protein
MSERNSSELSFVDKLTYIFPRNYRVGKHLSCDQWKFEPEELVISITKGLKDIKSDNIFGYTKVLIKEVKEDFSELAVLLDSDKNLRKVNILRGHASFPERLGEEFGFSSSRAAISGEKFTKFYRKLTHRKKLAENTDKNSELRKFMIIRENFIDLYYPKKE